MNSDAVKTIGLAGAASLLLSACGGGSGGGGGGGDSSPCGEFDCQAMVNNLGENVTQATVDSFLSAAQELETAVNDYESAVDEDGNVEEARADAQAAWEDAMAVWQRAKVMQVGPLVDNSGALRDIIYSWPATSSCGVDQEVIEAEADDYDISGRSERRRGLDALDYLLFTETLDHTCPAGVEKTAGWDDRSDADRRETRADYLVLAANDLTAQADNLASEWDGFVTELKEPGTGGSRFDNVEEAVNALSDALFYLEKQTNDTKLAEPAGFTSNTCGDVGTVCPDDVESPFSQASLANVINNIDGFRQMFTGEGPDGTTGPGFADFLEAQGGDGENIAQTMLADLDSARAELEAVDLPLAEAVEDDGEFTRIEASFEKMTEVNRQLKDQFLRVLGLSIPDAAAGDGD